MSRSPKQVRLALDREFSGPMSVQQLGLVVRLLEDLSPDSAPIERKVRRYTLLRYIYGLDTAKNLTRAQAGALIDWCQTPSAKAEALLILDEVGREHGQEKLL